MVDQRVAAEKQNGVGTPYIPPMTRRLKCRIDPEQSPYTCMLPEHKPVRRGREMIDLLAVEEPKPKPAKIRAVSDEAAIHQLFKRMRSSSSALTQQVVSTPRGPVPNERRRRRPPHGRRTGTTGEWPPAARGSPPTPAKDGPGRGPPDLEHGVAGERQPVAAGRQADHAVPGGVAAGATDDHPRRHLVFRLERPHLAVVLVQEPLGRPPKR